MGNPWKSIRKAEKAVKAAKRAERKKFEKYQKIMYYSGAGLGVVLLIGWFVVTRPEDDAPPVDPAEARAEAQRLRSANLRAYPIPDDKAPKK